MSPTIDQDAVRGLVSRNRYMSLATTEGTQPWVAPIEYMHDERLNLFFLSTTTSLHARHIEHNGNVAVAIFEHEQPAYSAGASADLLGVQMLATAQRLSPAEYPQAVGAAIAALKPPMPPYAVFRIVPSRFYLPKLRDGINERVEVDMDTQGGAP